MATQMFLKLIISCYFSWAITYNTIYKFLLFHNPALIVPVLIKKKSFDNMVLIITRDQDILAKTYVMQ